MTDAGHLVLDGIRKSFGGKVALNGVTLALPKQTIAGLIGPNGSGKTTLINCATGFLPLDGGTVSLEGKRLDHLSADRRARAGLVRTFQISRPFGDLSLVDNLVAGSEEGPTDSERSKAQDLLGLVGLQDVSHRLGRNLSYGQGRLLDLARVLMLEPKVILLDEPAAGVHPNVIERLKRLIVELNEQGTTFLIVEHNIQVIKELCSLVAVLHNGEKIAKGSMDEVRNDPQVVEAYLGTGGAHRRPHRGNNDVQSA
jgi:ABC-type branched-subunit amino acid transport system ATPase component